MSKESNGIYFWRIVFTCMILIFHFDTRFALFTSHRIGWYIAVEFFFIVSGFLLIKSQESDKGQKMDALHYTIGRYRKIYPAYLVSFLVTFMMLVITEKNTLFEIYIRLIDSFWEIIAMQGIGLARDWNYINPTVWYISVLFLAGHLIYYLLSKHKELFVNLIAPGAIIVIYSYLYRYQGNLDAVTQMDGFYVNYQLMRGFADMCIGVYAYLFTSYLKEHMTDQSYYVLKVTGVLGFLYVIFSSVTIGYTRTDFMYVFILAYSVAVAFIPSKHAVPGVIAGISEITLEAYLLHEVYRNVIFAHYFNCEGRGILQKIGYLIVYLLIVFLSAFVLNRGLRLIRSSVLKETKEADHV